VYENAVFPWEAKVWVGSDELVNNA
jgi:hypothetical protein